MGGGGGGVGGEESTNWMVANYSHRNLTLAHGPGCNLEAVFFFFFALETAPRFYFWERDLLEEPQRE